MSASCSFTYFTLARCSGIIPNGGSTQTTRGVSLDHDAWEAIIKLWCQAQCILNWPYYTKVHFRPVSGPPGTPVTVALFLALLKIDEFWIDQPGEATLYALFEEEYVSKHWVGYQNPEPFVWLVLIGQVLDICSVYFNFNLLFRDVLLW